MGAINQSWIDNLTAQINAVPDCATLQKLVDEISAEMVGQLLAAERQVAALAVLIIAPTDLPSVITWIKSQIALYEAQYAQAIAAEAALVAAYTQLINAITSKIAALNCTGITPPVVPLVPPPP